MGDKTLQELKEEREKVTKELMIIREQVDKKYRELESVDWKIHYKILEEKKESLI